MAEQTVIGYIQKRSSGTSAAVKYSELVGGTVEPGDIILVQLMIEAHAPITPPAGYTAIGTEMEVGGETQGYYWSRYVSGAEHLFTWTGSHEYGLVVSVVRHCVATGNPIDALHQQTGEGNTGTTGATSSAITTTHPDELVYAGFFNDQGWVWNDPTGFTEATPEHHPPCADMFYKRFEAGGSTGSVTGQTSTSGTSHWGSMLFALLPEVGAPPAVKLPSKVNVAPHSTSTTISAHRSEVIVHG